MLNRQKILISLLRVANRPVSRFELTKWSFLVRHESISAGGPSFYDFVPYQYGPFSFGLYQELDKLIATSYVHEQDELLSICPELTNGMVVGDSQISDDVQQVVKQFGMSSKRVLTDYVYEKHPTYTCNSRIRRLTARPVAKPAVYTAGYEGRSVDAFLNLLVENGIQRLIDVRRNPVARRYGFHRSTLERLCSRLDIGYVHFPNLGISSELRRDLESAEDYRILFAKYEKSTLRAESQALNDVSSLVAERPSVVVCMEKDPNFCHRSLVAAEVSKRSGLPICNLGCGHGCHD